MSQEFISGVSSKFEHRFRGCCLCHKGYICTNICTTTSVSILILPLYFFRGSFHRRVPPHQRLGTSSKVVVVVPSLDVRAQLESKFHHWKVCYRRLDFIIFSRDSGSRCHVPASLRSGESITTPCRLMRLLRVNLGFMQVWTLFQRLLSL